MSIALAGIFGALAGAVALVPTIQVLLAVILVLYLVRGVRAIARRG